jgi:predicted RNA-binding Zn ribbon-like protein
MNFRRYGLNLPFDALAENLVNSHDVTLDNPEHLRSPADLSVFLQEHGIAPPRRVTQSDLEAAKQLRSEVRELFEAPNDAQALRLLNKLLQHAKPTLAIESAGGELQLKWGTQPGADFDAFLRSAVAINLANVVTSFGFERLRVCNARPCQDVFLDLSKKGEQRYCGPKCATRTRVAAYRARIRG